MNTTEMSIGIRMIHTTPESATLHTHMTGTGHMQTHTTDDLHHQGTHTTALGTPMQGRHLSITADDHLHQVVTHTMTTMKDEATHCLHLRERVVVSRRHHEAAYRDLIEHQNDRKRRMNGEANRSLIAEHINHVVNRTNANRKGGRQHFYKERFSMLQCIQLAIELIFCTVSYMESRSTGVLFIMCNTLTFYRV